MSWVAYVDESIDDDSGLYVLAAATLDVTDAEGARDRVSALSQRGLPFHWRLELPARRAAAAALVAELAALQVVVVGAPMTRQERARRQCLRSLLFHLEEAGVEQVWMESRGLRSDSRDIAAVRAFRAQHAIGHAIRVDHALPSAEPLLWVADIVAGAVRAAEVDDPTYRAQLAGVLTEHRLKLDGP